eukprot:scaffold1060_cov246-Pinguiococcus_pyrenoidosus.AAC.19
MVNERMEPLDTSYPCGSLVCKPPSCDFYVSLIPPYAMQAESRRDAYLHRVPKDIASQLHIFEDHVASKKSQSLDFHAHQVLLQQALQVHCEEVAKAAKHRSLLVAESFSNADFRSTETRTKLRCTSTPDRPLRLLLEETQRGGKSFATL